MEVLTRTRRVGGSLMVTIPKEIVDQEGFVEDQLVKIEVKKARISGFGMSKGVGPFTKEDEFRGQLE